MRNILCLYLNTGGGHKAPATVLKQLMEEKYPDSVVTLAEGLSKKNKWEKFLIEKCYQISCNFIPGSWALFFKLSSYRIIQTFIANSLRPHTTWYMRRLIRKYKATDVVCFHMLLTPSIVSAIRQVNSNIRFTVFVTDPFSCSTSWFYDKKTDYIVASEQIKQIAVEKVGLNENQIKILPFLINPKFYQSYSESELQQLRKKHNIDNQKKVLLVTGGAGGLPNLVLIIQQIIRLKPDFTILVVCGKDLPSKKMLDVLAQLHTNIDLRVMGFIDNMDEMIRLCDCAIIKPGASTIFEVLGSHKPVIISTYLHGQELGNVQFAINNKVGQFIRKPKDIAVAVHRLLNNKEKLERIKVEMHKLSIEKDMYKVADYLHSKNVL